MLFFAKRCLFVGKQCLVSHVETEHLEAIQLRTKPPITDPAPPNPLTGGNTNPKAPLLINMTLSYHVLCIYVILYGRVLWNTVKDCRVL